jgi:hypothetical protein
VVPLNPPGLDPSLAQASPLLSTAQYFISMERVAAIACTMARGVSEGVARHANRDVGFDHPRCELQMEAGQYKEERGIFEGFFVVVPLSPPGLDPSPAQASPLLSTAQYFISMERVAAIARTITRGVSEGVARHAHRDGCFDRPRCAVQMEAGQYKEERGSLRGVFRCGAAKPSNP